MEINMSSKSKLFNDMGMKSCYDGDFEKALKHFNTGLAQDRDNILLLYNKAGCLVSMGEIDKAESVFKKVIRLCSGCGKSEFALNIKANSCIFLSDYEKSRAVLEELLEIAPDNVEALINMAQMLNKKFKYGDALEYFDRVLEIDSENPEALMYKGETLFDLFRYDEGKECIDKSFDISKDSPYIWYLKGLCEAHFKNHEQAMEYYSKAIEMQPDFEKCIYDMSKSLIILGRADDAKAAFNRMYDLHPDMYDDAQREVSGEIVDILVSHFSQNPV